jgi:GntR family transcriptional regulator/MocR family aminotransferase
MFKHAQLETVKAWIIDPANGSLPLHERIQRAIRTLILEGILSHGKAFLLHARWLLSAFPGYH